MAVSSRTRAVRCSMVGMASQKARPMPSSRAGQVARHAVQRGIAGGAGHACAEQSALQPGADRHEAGERDRQLQQPALGGGAHAACARGAFSAAKPQSSHSVKASTSAASTVAPHHTLRPGGASR